MCDKCDQLNQKIDHYKKLSAMIYDKRILDGLEDLIQRYEAEKASLHPEQK